MASYPKLLYNGAMKRLAILQLPLLAIALHVAACAGPPETPAERQTEMPPLAQRGEPEPPSPQEPLTIMEPGDRVFFDFDNTALSEWAIDTIDRQARRIKRRSPEDRLMIEGHTDDRGSREYNLDLGCRRARAMRDAFIERGIAAERLGIISYGEVRPAVLGANEPAWAQNRRAVLVVVDELWRSNCGER
jgi:peptidoglycan-associated lipoprotein